MVSKSNKHNHTLLSWITHIKHDHDSKPTSITIDPVVQKDPLLLQQPVNVTTTVIDPPPKARGSDASSENRKNSLIHFHRPHGLLFRQSNSNSSSSSISKEKQGRHHQGTTIETKLKTSPSNSESTCAYCQSRRASSSTNDADDEETINDDDMDSTRSIDGTKRFAQSCVCKSPASPPPRYNRENSVHSLPGDIDNPQTGFKKLRKDGYLDDLDDVSCLLFEQEEDDAAASSKKARRRVFSRAVIRNDLIRLALNGPFQSPIQMEDKRHVLHVGCSDGTWCIDTANLFPHWLVVGIDDRTGGLCPDQRKVPKNFKYIRCYYDLLRTLKAFPGDSFDFVYARFLFDAYSEKDYLDLIKECYRICKPNGYVELYELDLRIYGNPKAGPTTRNLNSKVMHSLESYQLDPRLARKIGDMVSNLTQVNEKKHFNANYTSLPLGLWGGRLGVLFRDSVHELFFENLKLQKEGFNDLSNNCNEETTNNKDIEAMDLELDSHKAFMNLHYVYARKDSCS